MILFDYYYYYYYCYLCILIYFKLFNAFKNDALSHKNKINISVHLLGLFSPHLLNEVIRFFTNVFA